MIITLIILELLFFMQFLENSEYKRMDQPITLFLCGDVMTGRGIDQVLPNPAGPKIYERYMKSARGYVDLAEEANGPIEKPVSFSYIWGDALEVWEKESPAFKIINLETSITSHEEPWPEKGINYRMHPDNAGVLTAAGIDFCALANNHTLDWGQKGLQETLQTLDDAGISHAGGGEHIEEAQKPAILEKQENRIIIFSYGMESSGIPASWAASTNAPGINLLPDVSTEMVDNISKQVEKVKQKGDVVIFSVHWGSNWGYSIPERQQNFARELIDKADVDLVHGHSSHHPKGIEVYKEKLIMYGSGDFINDYEGISGHEEYRDDLTLMYFPRIEPASGNLTGLKMVPMQIKNFQLQHASPSDAKWLAGVLDQEGIDLETGIQITEQNNLLLEW